MGTETEAAPNTNGGPRPGKKREKREFRIMYRATAGMGSGGGEKKKVCEDTQSTA